MPSRFGWVDFAENDRQRMLDVIHLFREQDTRDELGIGTIRDAFAEYFFPGTSTIQTRARYMLFIPWIYRLLEKRGVPSTTVAQKARQAEIKLIYALLESDDTEGIIGKEAKKSLQRLPSSVYWTGLWSWGIRLFPGSQDQYHRYLDTSYKRKNRGKFWGAEVDEELSLETNGENWDPGLPEPPSGFPDKAELALPHEEAQYLQDRIQLRHQDSLFALLATEKPFVETDYLWEHPLAKKVSLALKQDIVHAQNFSETIHGAALLYNLLLARLKDREEWIDSYIARFNRWTNLISTRWDVLATWHRNMEFFWSSSALKMAQVSYPCRNFAETWFRIVFHSGDHLTSLKDDREARLLIENREVQLKGRRARLKNPRALERWLGRSGDAQLEYRWTTAKNFARDILAGILRQDDSHA
jgi:hypothetical protein